MRRYQNQNQSSRVNNLFCLSHIKSEFLYLVGSIVFRRMGVIVFMKVDCSGFFNDNFLSSILKLHSN